MLYPKCLSLKDAYIPGCGLGARVLKHVVCRPTDKPTESFLEKSYSKHSFKHIQRYRYTPKDPPKPAESTTAIRELGIRGPSCCYVSQDPQFFEKVLDARSAPATPAKHRRGRRPKRASVYEGPSLEDDGLGFVPLFVSL